MEIDIKVVNRFAGLLKDSYEESKKIKNRNIANKELNDIVTDVDVFMENKIVEAIKMWYPNTSIISEECGEINKNSEYEWLIDPIDGTINFAAGIPLFSTSIALQKNGETIFGIIVDYSLDDIYYCIKGKGAFCNGEPIHVSNCRELKNSIVSFCLTSHYNDEHIKEVLHIEEKLASKVRGLRLIVSSAIELCWCASGKIDGLFNVKPTRGLSSAAGKLLVQEAGGKVTNLLGNEQKKIDTMLITNGLIHEEIVRSIS